MRLLLVPHARTRVGVGVGVHAFCMHGAEWISLSRNGETDDLPDLYLRLPGLKLSCMFYKTLIPVRYIVKKNQIAFLFI